MSNTFYYQSYQSVDIFGKWKFMRKLKFTEICVINFKKMYNIYIFKMYTFLLFVQLVGEYTTYVWENIGIMVAIYLKLYTQNIDTFMDIAVSFMPTFKKHLFNIIHSVF